jgi:uncharacterized protein
MHAHGKETRIEAVADHVKDYLSRSFRRRSAADRRLLKRFLSGWEYRWQHTLRVAQFGKVIAETEDDQVELVVVACLLHDIAWFDTPAERSREHGRVGAELSRPLLADLGYNQADSEAIAYAIGAHVDVEVPVTSIARILSDADNVDRYGPYRILQWCFSDIEDYDKLAQKLSDRLERLEHHRSNNPLFTPTGRQLFEEQLDLQIAFFSGFVGDKELSLVPVL